jgi:hypothetical protein
VNYIQIGYRSGLRNMDEVVKFSKIQDEQQAKMLGEGQTVPETGASDSIQKVLADFLHKSEVRITD